MKILSAALMYFTGIVDTFSVMLIQVMMIGGGITGTDIAWWMEPAYLLSFLIYLLVYLQILKKHEEGWLSKPDIRCFVSFAQK